MRRGKIIIFLIFLAIYFLLVYLFNRKSSRKAPYIISAVGISAYCLFKFIGKAYGLEIFFNDKFFGGSLLLLILFLYYPIVSGGYLKLKVFLTSKDLSTKVQWIFKIIYLIVMALIFYCYYYTIFLYVYLYLF